MLFPTRMVKVGIPFVRDTHEFGICLYTMRMQHIMHCTKRVIRMTSYVRPPVKVSSRYTVGLCYLLQSLVYLFVPLLILRCAIIVRLSVQDHINQCLADYVSLEQAPCILESGHSCGIGGPRLNVVRSLLRSL